MASKPNVFNIPASAPFLPTLIEALMADRLGLTDGLSMVLADAVNVRLT